MDAETATADEIQDQAGSAFEGEQEQEQEQQEQQQQQEEAYAPEETDGGGGEAESAPSPEFMARAQTYGLSADEIQGVPAQQLERVFASVDRQLMAPLQQMQQQPPPQSQQQQQQQAQPDAQQQQQAQAFPAFEPLAIEFGEDLDESVTGPIRQVMEYANAQLQQGHQYQQRLAQEIQSMNLARELGDFDSFVGSLGDDFKDDYGIGSSFDMPQTSKQLQKRVEVFQGAQQMMTNAQKLNMPLSRGEAWTRSHRAALTDKIIERETGKLNGKLTKRKAQLSSARPNRSDTKTVSARQAAERAFGN